MIEADARKGCFTQALKKSAAMMGIGRQAYEGSIDDDNVPGTLADEPTTNQHQRPTPQTAASPAVAAGGHAERNHLTSRQLAALWALARKLDIDNVALRSRVKERFGVAVEFLGRGAASTIIGELSAKLGNGHVRNGDVGHIGEAA